MDPFVGEIRMFGGNFAPAGWAFCDGSTLPISENDTLFQLIGTTYGGDGQSTFKLPDLRGRIPVHQGSGTGLTSRTIGQVGGTESVTLTTTQLPAHTHTVIVNTSSATTGTPDSGALLAGAGLNMYKTAAPSVALNPQSISSNANGNQAHSNVQPFLCVNFIISFFGIFPSQ
jgi:microcystin-dependent protein